MDTPFIYLLFLASLFSSCVREMELELDPVAPALVLNASVTPKQQLGAFLSKSWFLLDSVPDYALHEGTIRVYINDIFKGTMLRSDDPADTLSLKGQYVLTGYQPKATDRIRLEAEAPGFRPVKAETRVPAQTKIVSLDTVRFRSSDDGNLRMRVYVRFKDDPKENNYYRLVVEKVTDYWKGDSVRTTSSLSGSSWSLSEYIWNDFYLNYEDPVFQPMGVTASFDRLDGYYCRGVFPDNQINGQEYSVKALFYPVTDSFKGDSVTSLVHYNIRLLSISESYYYYLQVIRNFSVSFGPAYTDGLIEPTATYSNVTDGFGVVTGYQEDSVRLEMPFGAEVPFWNPWMGDYPYYGKYN